jgi:hypothetical protein
MDGATLGPLHEVTSATDTDFSENSQPHTIAINDTINTLQFLTVDGIVEPSLEHNLPCEKWPCQSGCAIAYGAS